MKKYILLATTAVLMTTANAFADAVGGEIMAGQMPANVELLRFASFSVAEGMSFGGMAFDADQVSGGGSDWLDLATMDVDSTQLSYNNALVKSHYNENGVTRGRYTYSGGINLQGGTFFFVNGEGPTCTMSGGTCTDTAKGLYLENGLQIKNITVKCTETPSECYLAGTLQATADYLKNIGSKSSISTSFMVGYSY